MQNLTGALKDAPTVACDTQLHAIAELRNVLRNWSGQDDITRAQQPSKVPDAVLPRVRNGKLSDMSEIWERLGLCLRNRSPTLLFRPPRLGSHLVCHHQGCQNQVVGNHLGVQLGFRRLLKKFLNQHSSGRILQSQPELVFNGNWRRTNP